MPDDLRDALAFQQRGELDRASFLYEAAIAADPSLHLAHHLSGMVALQRGDLAHALARLGQAIALQPNISEYHGGLAEAYWANHQRQQAVASALEAIRLNPAQWIVRYNLGIFLVALGQIDQAIGQFREVVRLKSDFGPVYHHLGYALVRKGDSTGAGEAFRTAVQLEPKSADAHSNLGKYFLDRGEVEAAQPYCEEAVRLQPNSPDAQNRLGNVYQLLGDLAKAESCFRRAIELRPDQAGAYASLGGLQEQLGETELSLASFREALRLNPDHAGALARLASRLKDRITESEHASIERLLGSTTLPSEQRLSLLFGLAQVSEAQGDFDRAAALSIEANARQHREFETLGVHYDAIRRANDIEQLIAAFTPEFFERVRGWGLETERPVFIVGMPRSGTSLVEQILASHSQVHGAGELRLASETYSAFLEAVGPIPTLKEGVDRLDRERVERLARRHLDGLETINRSADRIVDKMPENSLFLGLIAAIFLKARIIHCRRNARDTALSCWMTHFGQLRWSCEANHIASRIIETDRIMNHWQGVLPLPIFEVVYEKIVEDLEPTARDLIAWAGLDWEPACLQFHETRRQVRTASVLQVRQPLYRGSVGRWKNYERSLAFLFHKLAT